MHPEPEILRYFAYDHLPPALAEISKPFSDLAHELAARLEGPELYEGLRKLLEAKDFAMAARRAGGLMKVFVNAASTILVTITHNGVVTVAKRPHPDAVWGPPIKCDPAP